MAKSKMGSARDRMSSVVSGDRSVRRTPSTVYAQSPLYNPELGMPSTRTTFGTATGKTNLQKPKNIPRTFVPTVRPPVAVAVKPPAKKPAVVVKPTAKKPPKIATAMLRSALGMAPTKKATPSTKPPATRFGVVTGKTTGTRVSGGGGYGGGGTRGGGSLSGQGSGSRSAGTSRTGGTQRNDPVRG